MQHTPSQELESRLIKFGIMVIRMTERYKKDLPFSVRNQVIRSSTSIGANYAEAQNAVSRADFNNKVHIAKKEAAETRYWLQIIGSLLEDPEDVITVAKEAHEIVLILQKIISTLKANAPT